MTTPLAIFDNVDLEDHGLGCKGRVIVWPGGTGTRTIAGTNFVNCMFEEHNYQPSAAWLAKRAAETSASLAVTTTSDPLEKLKSDLKGAMPSLVGKI